jgi:hypothetical protein
MRFNWFTYSVVIGFMQREDPVAGIQKREDSIALGRPMLLRETGLREKGVRKRGVAEDARWQGDHLFSLAQRVINELRLHIWAAGIRKQSKQDLLLSLPALLRSHTELTVLQAYPFRVAINNFIEMEMASCCSIHLNDEELLRLWR